MRGGAWTDDDFIYFTPNSTLGMGLWQIAAKGGAPETVTKPKSGRDQTSHRWSQAVPGTKTLLFTIWSAVGFDNARVAALDLATGQYHELIRGATCGPIHAERISGICAG